MGDMPLLPAGGPPVRGFSKNIPKFSYTNPSDPNLKAKLDQRTSQQAQEVQKNINPVSHSPQPGQMSQIRRSPQATVSPPRTPPSLPADKSAKEPSPRPVPLSPIRTLTKEKIKETLGSLDSEQKELGKFDFRKTQNVQDSTRLIRATAKRFNEIKLQREELELQQKLIQAKEAGAPIREIEADIRKRREEHPELFKYSF